MTRTQVLIASPLEAELVARIREAEPRAEVVYEPDLLPPARYAADHRGDPAFGRDAEAEARWRDLLGRAEVLFGVPGDTTEGLADAVTNLPRLRWVHATSAGAGEQVRKAALPAEALERVTITTSSGVHAVPLAEFSVLGLLAIAKELPRFVEDQRAMAWPEVRRPLRELSGQTLFLLGLGEIGREVARLAKALGMRTVGFRRTEGPPPDWVDEVHGPERLPELAGQADAMVVSLPLTEQTAGLVDRATIERLPASCIFVNVGRGGVVDEPALIDALRDRRIAGAVLDVFATEPLPEDSPLWAMDNVLVTPHAAALSARENERITELFVDNLRRYLDGQPLRKVVEPGVYY
jgi:phosphoglycerate dehydrogenase-like enzyme